VIFTLVLLPRLARIDFFGSAVFVPIFLVSVGLLLDPKVMVEGETLKLAGLFIAASLAGKAASAGIARLALGYSGPQATLMLGLTIPQAAATLAAERSRGTWARESRKP
jgi:Kef-type K+ transport system membrane component KefB